MDNKVFSRTVSLFAALSFAACAPHNPAKPVGPGDIAAKAQATAGGQPGKITLYGVIANSSFAPQLHIKSTAGTGKDGATPETAEANKAVISATLPEQLPPAPADATLQKAVAFGCGDDQVAKYLNGGKNDAATIENKNEITAGLVVLCGKDPLKADAAITIVADKLILVDAELNVTAEAGLKLITEKLFVIGNNTIASVAVDSEAPAAAGAPLTLIVRADANLKNASLSIVAQGASYKAK